MQSGSLPCIFRILNLICFTYIGIALWKSYPYFATPYPDCSIYIRIAPRKLTLTSRSLILIISSHNFQHIAGCGGSSAAGGCGGCCWLWRLLVDAAAVAAAAGCGGCSWMRRLWWMRQLGGCGLLWQRPSASAPSPGGRVHIILALVG